MILLQHQPQLSGKLVIALLTNWFEIHVKELSLGSQRFVTTTAAEVVSTPGLTKSCEHVSLAKGKDSL